MKALYKFTRSALWKNKTRTLVTFIGIILSAALFTAVTTLGVSSRSYLMDATAYSSGDYFIRFDYSTEQQRNLAAEAAEVSQLGTLSVLGYSTLPNGEINIVAAGDDTFYAMFSLRLTEGRLPQTGNELVITFSAWEALGKPSLGESVTLSVTQRFTPPQDMTDLSLPDGDETFTKTFTLVGISEGVPHLDDWNLGCSHFFTKSEETQSALWHRLFLKTDPPEAAFDLQNRHLGQVNSLNSELLALYGTSRYVNYNQFLYAICAVLILIIMVGSVSLIYNAFSISLSERTKQFGLLSGIGATKKQLRRSVYYEALLLCGLAVPPGLIFGYGGIALTLYLLRDLLGDLLGAVKGSGVMLKAVPSAPAFLCAAGVSVLTTLLSTLIPARRAAKMAPISAIRQSRDYHAPNKKPRGKRSLFGISGLMARKYYQVSKSKYRSTVVSLSVTIVLFLAASGFSQVLQTVIGDTVRGKSFDLICYRMTAAQVEEIRALPGVEKSMVQLQRPYMTYLDEEDCTEDYRSLWAEGEYAPFKFLYLVYLEDGEFEAFLRQNDIQGDSALPPAVISDARIHRYLPAENGDLIRYTYEAALLRDGLNSLSLYPEEFPEALYTYGMKELGSEFSMTPTSLNGRALWLMENFSYGDRLETKRLYAAIEKGENGAFSYHLYDPVTDTPEEKPICTKQMEDLPQYQIVGSCSRWPYGTTDDLSFGGQQIALWLPLSCAENVKDEELELVLNTSDHISVLDYLDEQEILYFDHKSDRDYYRNLKTMVDVFSYGFIILISLICLCNIFNTISTNIALRRRDFGMLRSIGMGKGALRRMLLLECLRYGWISVLWGLPLGLGADYGIYRLTLSITNRLWQPPWLAMAIALGCVFAVVLASMAYSLRKLQKDDPITAIRMENL